MAKDLTLNRNAQQDNNQVYSLLGVQGTAGTADTLGTSPVTPISVDPTTGAMYVNNIGASGGGSGGTVVTIDHGTVSTNVLSGTVNSGTINAGTINLGTMVGKDADNAATTAFPVLTGGLFNGTAHAFRTDTNGNIISVGTINAGTINAATATITGGTINAATAVITGGTINANTATVAGGTINASTTTVNGGTIAQLTNGSIVVTAGTVVANGGTIGQLTNGSIVVTNGTIGAGTVNASTATLQPYPASQVQSAFAVGTNTAGTLVSAVGAGTGIYINSFNMIAMSGTLDMCLSYALGSTTNQVIARGLFAPGQGIAQSFPNPSYFGTANAALTYQILGGAGTATWAVTYNSKGTP